MLKNQVVRAEEFMQYFIRVRQLIADGLILDADQMIATMAEQTRLSLSDL